MGLKQKIKKNRIRGSKGGDTVLKRDLRERVYQKYKGHCAYCGKEIEYKDMQVDHLKPHLGYIKIRDDSFDNLMPSCRRCNHYKRSYMLDDFRILMQTLHGRIEQNYICKVALDYGIIEIHPFDGQFYFERIEIPF